MFVASLEDAIKYRNKKTTSQENSILPFIAAGQ